MRKSLDDPLTPDMKNVSQNNNDPTDLSLKDGLTSAMETDSQNSIDPTDLSLMDALTPDLETNSHNNDLPFLPHCGGLCVDPVCARSH